MTHWTEYVWHTEGSLLSMILSVPQKKTLLWWPRLRLKERVKRRGKNKIKRGKKEVQLQRKN